MTALIVVATLILCQIAWRAFLYLDAEPDLQLAIRAGMAFLMLSCLIGFGVLFNGLVQLSIGRDPSIFGAAGVAKFPHGVAIHAIQLFPILGWFLRVLGLPIAVRVRLIYYSIGALSGLLVFSMIQTLMGKPRFEFSLPGAAILAVSCALLAPVGWSVLRQLIVLSIRQCRLPGLPGE